MAQPPEFVGFVKPTVEHGEVEHAVHGGFHTAGAAGFFAAPWIVKPEVDALHQFAGHFHVVIFDEYDVLPEIGIARELDDFTDESFAG